MWRNKTILMKNNKLVLIFIPILLLLASIACDLELPATQETDDENAAHTEAAMTIEAGLTQRAIDLTITPIDLITTPTASETSPPGIDDLTDTPSQTPVPSATPIPTDTPTPSVCDWAELVGDLTIADGTILKTAEARVRLD